MLEAIRGAFEVDPSPCTAEELKRIMDQVDCRIPIYRIKRNLFLLVHTGKLAYDVYKKEFYGDPR